MNFKSVYVSGLLAVWPVMQGMAQSELIKFGDFDQWIVRNIKESGIIGGDTKQLYEIGPDAVWNENKAYTNQGGSPWATSNVMAKVCGITKTNTSVYREKRGPPGDSCRESESHGNCEYRSVGSRFCFSGQRARTDYQYVQSDEQIGCGHTFYQTSAGYQFRL